MIANLRYTQIESKPIFACSALDGLHGACEPTHMRVNLEQIRNDRDLRLEDIAAQLDVAISTVQRWEKRRHNIPTLRLDEILAAYQCSIEDVFGDGKVAGADTQPPANTSLSAEQWMVILKALQAPLSAGLSTEEDFLGLAQTLHEIEIYCQRHPDRVSSLDELRASVLAIVDRPSLPPA